MFSRHWRGEGNGNPLQYSSLENPVDRGAWWAAVHGVAQSQTQLKRLSMHACIGERNGNPLQCSCLENSRDRGAWWAAICGVAESRTRLKKQQQQQPVVRTLLSLLRAWVQSLVRELRFHKLHRMAKKNKKQKKLIEEFLRITIDSYR